ncbi:ABC transporter permease [Janibacter sp. G56]|uniref:ABC transporter permease n=1 Tax=Janibacter sp. G56 TaxID=3418717 RepID=UPI003D01D4AD
MTTTATTPATSAGAATPQRPSYARQVLALVRRNLIHIKRMPEMLADVTFQPIMFVLLFAYVFGGSIQTDGAAYREWLLPGIMAQTIAFSSFIVAVGLTSDIDKGVVDRFRSLPISRSAVLVARSISSLIHSSLGIVVMAVTGLFIGWRLHNGFAESALGFALVLLFGFAMIWIGIFVGSRMRSVEAVNGVMFTTMFPLTFLADTFAPAKNMPHWLRVIAEWNPISALTQAMRTLWGNGAPADLDAQWPMHHPVLASAVWSIAIAAIMAPIAIRAFQKRTEA